VFVLANQAEMHTDLWRINQILNQTYPLIQKGKAAENPNTRVQFQFHSLQADILKIQMGIEQALHRVTIQPRTVKALKGDYLPEQSP
jgi:RAQPRD family integrative conjugative element protein